MSTKCSSPDQRDNCTDGVNETLKEQVERPSLSKKGGGNLYQEFNLAKVHHGRRDPACGVPMGSLRWGYILLIRSG